MWYTGAPAPPSQPSSKTADLVLSCLVQFAYTSTSASATADVDITVTPFLVPVAATVEVFGPPSSYPLSSSSPANIASEVESGLRICPVSSALQSSALHASVLSSSKADEDDVALRWNATRQRRQGVVQGKSSHSSLVRAVRRAPRTSAHEGEASVLRGASLAPAGVNRTQLQADAPVPFWLPFSSVFSLDWSFKDVVKHVGQRQQQQQQAVRTSSTNSIPACSTALRGASEGRSSVVVRLRCVDGVVTGQPPHEVESVVLHHLACTDALALADAFDAVTRRMSLHRSTVPPVPSPLHRLAPAACTDQQTDAYTKLGSAGSPTLPTTFTASVAEEGNSHHHSDALTRLTRSINFTDSVDVVRRPEMEQPLQPQPQSSLKEAQSSEPSSPHSGEVAAYNRYAKLLGVEPPSLHPPHPQHHPLHAYRNSTTAHSPVAELFSPVSFSNSFGGSDGFISAVSTPLGATLQFPRRDSAAVSYASPDEKELAFQGDPLSEPIGPSHHYHQLQRGPETEDDEKQGHDDEIGAHVARGDARPLTLPGVVEATGDAPAWFPAALQLSDASEVTVSSTDGSMHRDGAVKTPVPIPFAIPAAATAAGAASSTLLLRNEPPSSDDRPIPTHGGLGHPRDAAELNGHALNAEKLRAMDSTAAAPDSILFPPLPPPASSASVSAAAAAPISTGEGGKAVPHFKYLTQAQRQLVNFDDFLRPTIPPTSATVAMAADMNPLHPPAALDQVILKLRMSSLPPSTARITSAPANGSTTATATRVVVSSSDTSGCSFYPSQKFQDVTREQQQQQGSPPATTKVDAAPVLVAAPPFESRPASSAASAQSSQSAFARVESDNSAAAAIPTAAGATHLVSSYQRILQQMRDRQRVASDPSTIAATAAAAAPPAASVSGVESSRALSPQRAHGPFAQPTQHPPGTFLAQGSHRTSASPSSSPHRRRRLPASSSAAAAAAPSAVAEPQHRGIETPFHVLTNNYRTGALHRGGGSTEDKDVNERGSSSPDSSQTLLLPSWLSARARPSKGARSPQTPMQLLPRRPEPLIGTPKLALDQAASGTEPPPSPMILGKSLVDEDGRPSSTSMAT